MLWLCIRLPALRREALAASDHEAIERLAAWAYQWSSLVSYRLNDATGNAGGGVAGAMPGADAPLLWLELGASSALFGGHAALLAKIEGALTALGYSHTCAVAPSPSGAALLTRASAQRCAFTRTQLRSRLVPLPLSWLELPRSTVAALRSTGLHRIGELLALPAAALARRFGPQCCLYLERLLGKASDPQPPWQAPEVYHARCEFAPALHDAGMLLFPLRRLLQEFQGYLRGRDCAVQRFTLQLQHPRPVDRDEASAMTPVTIGLSAPAREATRFLLLARERLQNLVLTAPICALQLTAREFTAPSIVQPDLFGNEVQQFVELAPLLDRLRARLGEQAVQGVQCHADHRPERACKLLSPEQSQAQAQADEAATGMCSCSPPRPAALLPRPQRIAAAPQLLSAAERIESGWWDGGEAVRDYYIARAADGARLWVFRDLADGAWYVQGLWV